MDIAGYHIDKKIGKGGMATVYLATQISLDRPVVLKILDIQKTADNNSQIERFLAEGRIVAALNHPNIITIYDIGIADDNSLYISMEYVQGGDLKARIGIPMDPLETFNIITQIARGLGLAHEKGIIHRDVKPANILFRLDGTPLITDFGIAKQIDNDLNLTSTGIFLGSPNYISPEQATDNDVDRRTDIYSLGCIYFEMLTSNKPYKAQTVFDVVMQHKNSPIPQLPDDLKNCQPILSKMMAKSPKDRYASMEDLIAAMMKIRGTFQSPESVIDFIISDKGKPGKKKKNKISNLLLIMLFISALFFTALQFVEIRLKSDKVDISEVAANTALQDIQVDTTTGTRTNPETVSNSQSYGTASDEVINALMWLGNKSLEEYKLTYPPQDNAHYYFSRLLEINPDNLQAKTGILEIANRYAILAEQSLVKNDPQKTEAYINIGLEIDPSNQTLLALKKLNRETTPVSLGKSIKQFFARLFN